MAHRDISAAPARSVDVRRAVAVVVAVLCSSSVFAIGSPAGATGGDVAIVGDPVLGSSSIAYNYGYASLRAGPAAGAASAVVDPAAGTVTVSIGDSTRPATVTMAWPARTGSWSLAPDGADPEQHASVTRGPDSCTFYTGTLTVTTADIDPDGGVAALSADLSGGCMLPSGGNKQVAAIRIGDSSRPVAMPRATPVSIGEGVVGGSDFRRDVTVTNDGSATWTISSLGMASANAWSPSISVDPSTTTCVAGTVLGAGDHCIVTLRMLSVPSNWFAEQLVVLGTGRAALVVPVRLDGHAPVAAPTGVVSHPGRLGTLITWDAPATPPKEGYRVYNVADGQRTLLVKAPANATKVMVPGTGVRHLVLVATDDNLYAESPDVAVDVEEVVTSEVIAQRGYATQMVFPTELSPGNERTTTLRSGAVDPSRQRWVGLQSNAVSICHLDSESCSVVPGTLSTSSDTMPRDVVWLPDGDVAYLTGADTTTALWLAKADGSSDPHKVADLPRRTNLAAAPSSAEVLVLDYGSNYSVERIRLSDGHVSTIPNTSDVDAFTASNHGILLLERRTDLSSGDGPRQTTAIKLDGSAARVIPLPAGDNRDATFDPTGTQIAYVHHLSTYEATVWVAQADGSSPRQLSDTSGAWFDLQWSVGDQAAPSMTIAGAPFTGATADFGIVAADPDDSAGSLTSECSLDGGPWTTCLPDSTSYAVRGLSAGQHVLHVRVTDPSGLQSAIAGHTWTVDRLPPHAALSAPPAVQFTKSYRLSWSGSDTGGSGVSSYEIRIRSASAGTGFGSYSSPTAWRALTGSGMSVTIPRGAEQCWSIRARDRAGNVGAWSAERCTVAALDDRSLVASPGWKRLSSASAVYGTYSRSTRRGTSLHRNGVAARQIGIVVTTCPTCGALSITHAGVTLGRISLTSATTKTRQVLWLPTQARSRSGTLVLKSLKAKQVLVDGIVVRH